ncbi:MAG TPA: RDD family protein [Streptosporangiaceae bacterium]
MTEVVTGEAVVLEVPCASFPSRLLALVIDMAIQVVLFALLLSILGVAALNNSLNAASVGAIVVTVVVAVIVGYPVIWETLSRGRSPGKFALGLRVVSDDGGPERLRQALVRGLAAAVEIWMLLGCPALICSLLSVRGKRLGDLFAGTFVIQQRLPARRSAGPAPAMTPELAHWAAGLEMSRLSEQTAATARRYLARLPELAPAVQAELGERIAAAVRAQVSPPPPAGMPAPVYLSAVLAERRGREQARLTGAPAPVAAHPAPAHPGPAVSAPPPGVGEQPPPGEPRAPNTGGFVPPA